MIGDCNHALFTGVVPPVHIPVRTLAEAQAAFDAHTLTRPDHLKALHPSAPKALRDAFTDWAADHRTLKAELDKAKTAAASGWRDAEGNPTTPQPWKADPTAARDRAAEARAAHRARKAAGTVKANGRPRSETPSPEALRKRALRAKKRGEA